MVTLDEYANKYQCVRMERRDGILQLTLHTNEGSLHWGFTAHEELPQAFHDTASDPENRVVIMTGAGDAPFGPAATRESRPRRSPSQWDKTYWEGKHLQMNLLDIEVPMISAIHDPALRHPNCPCSATSCRPQKMLRFKTRRISSTG